MCQYITATCGDTRDEDAIRRLAESLHLKWVPLDSPWVAHHLLLPSERYYFTTRNSCDCGTSLGRRRWAESLVPVHEARIERELLKHRKRGWTETRIQRWLEQLRVHEDRHREQFTGPRPESGTGSEIDRWIEFVTGVVKGQFADWVGVLLHTYHGGLETEELEVKPSRWMSLPELTPETLLDIEEDVLYRFSRDGRKR
jgi:hypothetical protein